MCLTPAVQPCLVIRSRPFPFSHRQPISHWPPVGKIRLVLSALLLVPPPKPCHACHHATSGMAHGFLRHVTQSRFILSEISPLIILWAQPTPAWTCLLRKRGHLLTLLLRVSVRSIMAVKKQKLQ